MILEIKTFNIGSRIGHMALWDERNIEFLGLLQPQKPWRSKITMPIFEQIHFFKLYGLALFLYVARLITSKNIDKIFLMNNEKSANSERN